MYVYKVCGHGANKNSLRSHHRRGHNASNSRSASCITIGRKFFVLLNIRHYHSAPCPKRSSASASVLSGHFPKKFEEWRFETTVDCYDEMIADIKLDVAETSAP